MNVKRYKSITNLFIFLPLIVLMAAIFTSTALRENEPEPYDTYDRSLPLVETTPGTQVFEGPGYTFTIPAGYVTLPNAGGGDVRMTPEAWLPIEASVTVSVTTVDVDADKLSDKALEASARKDGDGVNLPPNEDTDLRSLTAKDGSRVVVWDGCCSSPEPVYALVYKGTRIITIKAEPYGEDDGGAFATAVEDIVGTLMFA